MPWQEPEEDKGTEKEAGDVAELGRNLTMSGDGLQYEGGEDGGEVEFVEAGRPSAVPGAERGTLLSAHEPSQFEGGSAATKRNGGVAGGNGN